MPAEPYRLAFPGVYAQAITTAQTLLSLGFRPLQIDAAVSCTISVDVAPLRYTYDGAVPTSTNGYQLATGASIVITGNALIRQLQFIQQSAGALVNITLETDPRSIVPSAYANSIKALFGANLIAYWLLNELQGTVANDSSGNGNNGAYVAAPTLGQPGIGDGNGAVKLDGATQYINVFSNNLAALFNNQEGTLGMWIRVNTVTDWTDGVNHRAVLLAADTTNNFVRIYKSSANALSMQYMAGAVSSQASLGSSLTSYLFAALTWSKSNDRVRGFVNGAQAGANVTGLGVWAGALTTGNCLIGAQNGPAALWDGYGAHTFLLNREATPTEIAQVWNQAP